METLLRPEASGTASSLTVPHAREAALLLSRNKTFRIAKRLEFSRLFANAGRRQELGLLATRNMEGRQRVAGAQGVALVDGNAPHSDPRDPDGGQAEA